MFVVVDEALEDLVVKGEGVVVSQMIEVKIDGVGGREEPVRKLAQICVSGVRKVHETAQIIARIGEIGEVVQG